MSWQEALVGQTVLVVGASVFGKVAKLYAPGTYLRADHEPDEKPIDVEVLELENGHCFLASDKEQLNFMPLSPKAVFVIQSGQNIMRSAIETTFRMAMVADLPKEMGYMFSLAILDEAQRALMMDPKEGTDAK